MNRVLLKFKLKWYSVRSGVHEKNCEDCFLRLFWKGIVT